MPILHVLQITNAAPERGDVELRIMTIQHALSFWTLTSAGITKSENNTSDRTADIVGDLE